MPPSPDQRTEYQAIAPWYDRLIVPLLQPEYRQAEACTTRLNPATVVDLCCGTGALARRMAGQNVHVTGVDLSRDMLNQAQKNHVPGTTFLHADAAWTGLPSDHFDLAVISMALHEKPALLCAQILGEAKRLITPRGHIMLIDYAPPASCPAHIMHLFANVIERMAGKEHHTHYQAFLASGGLKTLIRTNGLVLLTTTSFHHGLIEICLTATAGTE